MNFNEDVPSFPLCKVCLTSLTPCPNLCRQCASPLCPVNRDGACLRPWIHHSSLNSFSAQYLLLKPTYSVLRKWKIHGGLLFDRQILTSDVRISVELREQLDAVVPIPQNFYRAWKMKGSRAERIASWVSSTIHAPLIRGLESPDKGSDTKRQATLSLSERFKSTLKFQLRPEKILGLKRIILVDDFMTTGRTLDQAAKILKEAGVVEIHAFCLGIRAFKFRSELPLPEQDGFGSQKQPQPD